MGRSSAAYLTPPAEPAGLPPGWTLTIGTKDADGFLTGDVLRNPIGRRWPLIGNRTPAQRAKMVRAIITAAGGYPEQLRLDA